MKITKSMLVQMINEEMTSMKTADVSRATTDTKKAMVQGGIDDAERGAINTVTQKLAMAAKKGNILSGTLKSRLEQLVIQIDKVLGTESPPQEEV